MTTFNRDDSIDLPVLTAAPQAPEAGRKKLYVGDDEQFYAIDGQGNVTALQAAAVGVTIIPLHFASTPDKAAIDAAYATTTGEAAAVGDMCLTSQDNNTNRYLLVRGTSGWSGFDMTSGNPAVFAGL